MKRSLSYLLFFAILISSGSCVTESGILGEGAVGDGQTLNTEVIQQAIDNASENGNGTVVIPPGRYVTGTLILKSGVTLELEKGAVLMGSQDLNNYLSIQPDFIALRTGTPTKQLIFAEGQQNIAIKGEGTIDGRGGTFEKAKEGDNPGVTRPHLIQLINCENVEIEGVTMLNSGGWMQHYLACKNLRVEGIRVYNHCNYNNDGLDIDGCENTVISNCIIDSDDDAIVLKSTSPEACKDIVISNCVVKSHCNAIKLGTESTGGFENISISNCVVSPSDDKDPIYGSLHGQSAISVEMVDGGVLDGVNINNISVSETDCPIFIRLGNRARKYTDTADTPGFGTLQNVKISDVVATTSSKITSSITGIEDSYAENILLSNIIINNLSGGTIKDASINVPEKVQAYPTARMFGDILPASGFFVRHVKNITFNNVQIHLKKTDYRPAFIFRDVKNATLNHPLLTSTYNRPKLISKDQKSEHINVN